MHHAQVSVVIVKADNVYEQPKRVSVFAVHVAGFELQGGNGAGTFAARGL